MINIHLNKKIFILRPTLIHGKDNKGNFKLLDKFVNFRIPWPFKAFENKRSFCTLDNLIFIINELVIRDDIKLGIYNICDNEFISTNELVEIIAKAKESNILFLRVPRKFIYFFFNIFDFLGLPINNSTLLKITGSFEVSNKKIVKALNKNLPYDTRSGLIKSFLKS